MTLKSWFRDTCKEKVTVVHVIGYWSITVWNKYIRRNKVPDSAKVTGMMIRSERSIDVLVKWYIEIEYYAKISRVHISNTLFFSFAMYLTYVYTFVLASMLWVHMKYDWTLYYRTIHWLHALVKAISVFKKFSVNFSWNDVSMQSSYCLLRVDKKHGGGGS